MIKILPETPSLHAGAIEALYDATFGPGHFAKTAERLREHNKSLPALNRVGVDAGRVVAVARIWPVTVETGGPALFVGPVAVAPSHRGARLGQDVTRASLEAARLAGWTGAILIGDGAYFGEVGFRPVPAGRLVFPGPQDAARIMVCDLAGSSDVYAGKVWGHESTAPVDNRHRRGLVSGDIHT